MQVVVLLIPPTLSMVRNFINSKIYSQSNHTIVHKSYEKNPIWNTGFLFLLLFLVEVWVVFSFPPPPNGFLMVPFNLYSPHYNGYDTFTILRYDLIVGEYTINLRIFTIWFFISDRQQKRHFILPEISSYEKPIFSFFGVIGCGC